ncbi:BBS10 protein, partial [Crypturellus undulatus]|nr:BBS10 protein [Crypturellus undulatus]
WHELHVAVPGLPLARSRLLAGLLLRGRLTAGHPAGDDMVAVVVAQPLLAGLGDVELELCSEAQLQAWQRRAARSAEAIVGRLQSSHVKLLLSAGKQHEVLIYFAKLYGITVVEGLSPEEITLLCKVTGVAPFTPQCHDAQGEVTDVAVAAFCQPLLLGSERYVHLGFSSTCAFQPHCLILCGPAPGIIEQHADSLQGAFKMLEQLSETVEQ